MQSILFRTLSGENTVPCQLTELHLADTFFDIINHTETQKSFFKVLGTPCVKIENVLYRQAALKDFLNNEPLLEAAVDLLNRLSEFNNEFLHAWRAIKSIKRESTQSSIYSALSSVQISSFFLKRIYYVISGLRSLFEECDLASDALKVVKTRLDELILRFDEEALPKIASEFENINIEETENKFYIHFGKYGKIDQLDLLNTQKSHLEKPSFKWFSHKHSTETKSAVTLPSNDASLDLIADEFHSIAEIIAHLSISVIAEFKLLKDELLFYKGAVRYVRFLEAKQCSYCFPEFNNNTQIYSLYDIYLLTKKPIESIVSNDFIFHSSDFGCIINGDNSSGKTVYLRSVACAYLFFQAGLPVPAETAQISIVKGFYFCFANEESSNYGIIGAGRFENEVREVSKIVLSAQYNSVVFLNEIFQSTKYSEAVKGLSDVLNYLSKKGSRWLVVTHLGELTPFQNDKRIIKITLNNFKASSI
jgi:DNA mismatch repair ATPase MutS